MNSLEKYAAKKKITERLAKILYGDKPGLWDLYKKTFWSNLKGQAVGGGIGGAVGGLAGMTPKARKMFAMGGRVPSKGTGAKFGGLMGADLGSLIGGGIGTYKGYKGWKGAKGAYAKRKLLTNNGMGTAGAGGLAALLAGASKSKKKGKK